MQEDKTTKWLASMLRKQQEENPLPYELGAWEAFEKKRAAIAKTKTTYWISGIAASLALLLVAGGIWLSTGIESIDSLSSDQIALEDRSSNSSSDNSKLEDFEKSEGEVPVLPDDKSASKTEALSSDSGEKVKSATPVEKQLATAEKSSIPKIESGQKNQESTGKQALPLLGEKKDTAKNPEPKEKQPLPAVADPKAGTENPLKAELFQSLIATEGKVTDDKDVKNPEVLKKEVITPPVLPKEPQLTEEEIEEILETPSFARLALGLSPGFGASQTSAQATSGSSLGLGLMVDMDVAGKLVMGSGLAVNYLNQASESQSYAQVAGFSSPVTEKNEIAQVQVDIPLYFKYPITRNQSITVQAGFSNLVTFNQTAETESSYTRQIAVLDAYTANASSFTLKSESVGQLSVLEVPQNRFYPFATANLGVNFRLFESKKTSYEVMPFYNYPLQEFSGYGEKLGMFGASFKVNFGTIQKK